MGFFKFFRSSGKEEQTAKLAKDRLQVLIAHQRTDRTGPDYLPMLRQDILDVIKKYVSVGDDALSVQIDQQEDCDVLELNITLPEDAESNAKASNVAKRRALERQQEAAKVT
ncbi:MAG: cell division topological specificity factor MinE [Granulosicoccus sp.]